MGSEAQKLLERMIHSKAGWKCRDIERLYEGFGFIIQPGRKHDIVKHPIFKDLRTTLPRHNEIAMVYVQQAIKLIAQLQELEKKNEPKP